MSRFGSVALAGAVLIAGCGEGSTGPEAVTSVGVSPAAVTLAVGQTTSLAGTPLDGQGHAVPDKSVTWASEDATVASVSDAGLVTGVAEGSTSVTATSDGVSGSATVTVLPPPVTSVEVTPASPSLLPGETVQLTATPRDAQGGALTGRTIAWLSNDVSVATVDQAGLVMGVSPGQAVVFATSEGSTGEAVIDVDNPDAPLILSIVPAEIVEGQPATISGANFSPTAAQNVVTIDGVRADVTGGNESALDIVVPPLDCRPRHLAEVTVTVSGDTDQTTHPVRPGSFFQLDPGELALLQDPAAYCLQFDATTPDEEYLLGVQSTTEDPSSLTFVQVVGDADGGAPATLPGPVVAGPAPSGAPLDDDVARMLEWRAREAQIMHREIEMARRLPRPDARTGPRLVDPPIPGDITVGSPVTLRYPDLDFIDTCANYVEIAGTVRHVGTHAIWISDDDNPANGYDDADYQSLGEQFDNDVYAVETAYFGLPADEDANGRIVVVVSKEVNDDEIGGIVPSANVFPRASCPASNEGEYFFMFAPDPEGVHAIGTLTRAQALQRALPIIGHEFVHNIHVSRRVSSGLGFWDSWMHEGQATHGEEILGHALNGRLPGQNYDWAVVNNVPQTADRAWYLSGFVHLFLYFGWGRDGTLASGQEPSTRVPNAPEGCSWIDTPEGTDAGVCASRGSLVYGVTWTFLRWLTDHYAGAFAGGEAEMHTAWIDDPLSGFASLEALTGQPIEELLARWAASLYLDDRVAGLDPLLTLPSYDLLDMESNVVPEARLEPRVSAFGDFTQGVQVRGASAAYFLVTGADRPSTAVRVRAPSGGFLSPNIQIWLARVR